MDRNDVHWRGYWAASPTPFDQGGALDEPRWRELLQLYVQHGVHGVMVNGTTGEWFSQSTQERKRVAEIAVEELKNKIPVVIGCTSYTPQQSCELARHAESVHADGVVATPPPYVVPTPREVIAFFRALSDGTKLPVMVYNWPRGTNVEIDRDIAIELAKIDRIVAIKDSTADKVRAMATLEAVVDRVRVFGTFINRVGLGLLGEIGGDGNIDGGALGARYGVGFYEAVWKTDWPSARRNAAQYVALSRQLVNPDWSGRFGSPQAQLKAAMNILGQPGGYPRPPILPIEERLIPELADVLRSADLVRASAAP